jgi:phosphocarrier protein HPr
VEAERTVQLKNAAGLHARPCHAIARAAAGFESELTVSCGSTQANGKSILSLMTLCAPCHSELHLLARGRDAEDLIACVTKLFESGFDEID